MLKDLWKVLRGELSSYMLYRYEQRISLLEERSAKQNLAIREMDNVVFQMSQCTDVNELRSLLGRLTDPMMERKQLESKRIGNILVEEIRETYTP